MSIKIQKKIRYIPFVHCVIIWVWALMCFRQGENTSAFFKKTLKIFLALLIVALPSGIMEALKIRAVIIIVVNCVLYYFTLLTITGILIKDQNAMQAMKNDSKSIEQQLLYHKKLIEVIRLLAAPAEIQLASFPECTCRPDEITFTFDEIACNVDDCELVSDEVKAKVKHINGLFNIYFSPEDWTEEAVISLEKWQNIRVLTLELLKYMEVSYSDPHLFWIKDIF